MMSLQCVPVIHITLRDNSLMSKLFLVGTSAFCPIYYLMLLYYQLIMVHHHYSISTIVGPRAGILVTIYEERRISSLLVFMSSNVPDYHHISF